MSHIVCLTSYESFASWCYGITVSQRTQATFMPFHPNAFETHDSNLKSFRLHKKFVSAQSCSFVTSSVSLLRSIILKNNQRSVNTCVRGLSTSCPYPRFFEKVMSVSVSEIFNVHVHVRVRDVKSYHKIPL